MVTHLHPFAAAAVVAAALFTPGGAGSIKPHPSAYRMANLAQWIVEGRLLGDGRIEVATEYHVAPGVGTTRVFAVPSLAAMPRVPFDWNGRTHEPIRVDTVLLFLQANPDDGAWEPLHLLEGRARGVLWFAGDEVWGYAQQINPGPYELTRWQDRDGDQSTPADPPGVRREIAAGLVARQRWQATLAIADPERRAAAVADWFSPRTSPDGARWQEREWPDLQAAAQALGERMVAPLAKLIATDPDEGAVGAAVRVLCDLQTEARDAVPAAIGRLRDLRGARAFDLLRLLRAAQDPRAIDVLRDQVASAAPFAAAEAGLALHCCGDAEAAARLRARLTADSDGTLAVAEIAALLDALHDIDAAAAEALVRTRFAQLDALWTQRNWLRRLAR